MSYTIRFSQLASDDLTEILGWYKEQNIEGLHKQFIEAISKVLRRLENNPRANTIVHKNVRQALLKKFPYKILYTFDNAISLSFTKNATLRFGKVEFHKSQWANAQRVHLPILYNTK